MELTNKTCTKCKRTLPITEYYMATGKPWHRATCKDCYNRYSRLRLRDSYDTSKQRERDILKRDRRKTHKEDSSRWSPEKKLKNKARYTLRNAVATGKIIKKPCGTCGSVKAHAHHYLGYEGDNWAKVLWLCRIHHMLLHRKN